MGMPRATKGDEMRWDVMRYDDMQWDVMRYKRRFCMRDEMWWDARCDSACEMRCKMRCDFACELRCDEVRWDVMRCDAKRCDKMRSTMRCNPRCDAIQYMVIDWCRRILSCYRWLEHCRATGGLGAGFNLDQLHYS